MAWQVVIPVSNIALNVNTFTFGNLTFHQANTYNVSTHWNIQNQLPAVRNSINRVYGNRVIVEANNIKGKNPETAIRNTGFELERVYDLFSLTFYNINKKIVILYIFFF